MSRFSQSQKSLRHRGPPRKRETCCPQQSFGTIPVSIFLFLSLFVYLRYAYTSIIQMRSQQEASSCGLSRSLAHAALNPFSAFAFAFTFVLLCFACIYLALCLEALPLREAGSRAARGSAALMGKLMGKQFHAFCNGSRVAVCRSQWQMELWSVGEREEGSDPRQVCVCVGKCFLFYFICKTDKVGLSSFEQILKCMRV